MKEKINPGRHIRNYPNIVRLLGRGGVQVVSLLAFYSDYLSLNPAEGYGYLLQNWCLKKNAN